MFRFATIRLAVKKGLPIELPVNRLSSGSLPAATVEIRASPSSTFTPSAQNYLNLRRTLSWTEGETGIKYAVFDPQPSSNELEWVSFALINPSGDSIGLSNQAQACLFSEGAAPELDVISPDEYIRSIRVGNQLYQETQRELIIREIYNQLEEIISARFQELVVADSRIEAYRVVAFLPSNRVIHADNANTATIQSVYGFSLTAGDAGANILCAFAGYIVNPSWSLEVGRIYYLINDGLITSIPTYNRGVLLPVGIARTPTKLLIRFTPPGLSVPSG